MKTITWAIFVIASLVSDPAMTAQEDTSAQWQQDRLFDPSATQRAAERSGRVVIYDRLDEALVDKALDRQFERIENMMFVRVRHTQPDGEVVESGDCE